MRVWKEVNKDNLINNIMQIRKVIGDKKIIAVVKSDAYGNGSTTVAEMIKEHVEMYAVSNIDEAIELRKSGVTKDILILGYMDYDTINLLAKYDIIQAVSNIEEAKMINEEFVSQNKVAKIHIKLNTGMNRFGFDGSCDLISETISEIKEISNMKNVNIDGIFSHLAFTDEKELMDKQEIVFDNVIKMLEENNIYIGRKHLLNTSGCLNNFKDKYDLVRLGIGLYGLYPSNYLEQKCKEKGIVLKETLTIKSKLLSTRKIKKGEIVSYGGRFEAKKDTVVGVVGIGYDDGYLRKYSCKSKMIIRGKYVKVLGTVCMNACMVDITDVNAEIGDEVIILGGDENLNISAKKLASLAGTIHYETICNFKIKKSEY